MPAPAHAAASDADLVRAYLGGDEAGATALVTRHAAAVGRYLAGVGADPGEVEDLLQEAFFRAFRRIDGWRGEASFKSWLCTIAGNLLKDEYRKRKGRKMLPLEERDLTEAENPESILSGRELEQRLAEGLATLPRLQREVFLLRAQQGAEYEEIATALGTTPGAARVHYHHAMKRLKELIT
jgi:RNA polymerase sigma-70 factor (ECF subfamily)